jgi:hypothetical protein
VQIKTEDDIFTRRKKMKLQERVKIFADSKLEKINKNAG